MEKQKHFLLAAGGTGGHVFPAIALLAEIRADGHKVSVFTDERGQTYWNQAGVRDALVLPAGGLVTGSLLKRLQGLAALVQGYSAARTLLKRIKPDVAVGFGGYPSAAPLLAAQHLSISSLLHEQNSVMGKANRLAARKAKALALSFPETKGLDMSWASKSRVTGNPVRADICALSKQPFEAPLPFAEGEKPGQFRLLVMGGSLGARFLSQTVTQALLLLPDELQAHVSLCMQVRTEDRQEIDSKFKASKIQVRLKPFIENVAEEMAQSHLLICRAGATSVAEVAASGRPALFIPLDMHADKHQVLNAGFLANQGAAWSQPQGETSAQTVAQHLESLIRQPDQLQKTAQKALEFARHSASHQLYQMALGQILAK